MAYTLWKVAGGAHQHLAEIDKPLDQVAPMVMLMAVQISAQLNAGQPIGEVYAQGAYQEGGKTEGMIVGVVAQHGGTKESEFVDIFLVEPCTEEEWITAVGQPPDRTERDPNPGRPIGALD